MPRCRLHSYLLEYQGPDLQNILRQSYDYLTTMPKLRSTYDRRLIHKTSYEGRKLFACKIIKSSADSVSTIHVAYDIPKRNLSTL